MQAGILLETHSSGNDKRKSSTHTTNDSFAAISTTDRNQQSVSQTNTSLFTQDPKDKETIAPTNEPIELNIEDSLESDSSDNILSVDEAPQDTPTVLLPSPTTLSLSDEGKNKTSNIQSETPTPEFIETVYEKDKLINTYINAYNKANPEKVITKDLAQTYYHHGSYHDNQIKFSKDGFEISISNIIGRIKIVISGERNKNNDDYKSVFYNYSRGFELSLSNDQLSSYWNKLLRTSTNSAKFEEFESDLTIYNDKIEMIVIEGKLK